MALLLYISSFNELDYEKVVVYSNRYHISNSTGSLKSDLL